MGITILVIKLGAWWITSSNTILSDALESIVNIVMAAVALISLRIAALPKDSNHPYGHGKIEFLYTGMEGTLIAIGGIIIIVKSVYNFFNPVTLTHLDWGIWLIGITGVVNYIAGVFLEKQGKKTASLTLQSSGTHLNADAITTIGLIIGLACILLFDTVWLDNLLAIAFGIWIIFIGYKLVRQSVGGIMDETDEALIEDVVKWIKKNRQLNWVDVHNLRIIRYGADLHFDLHLTVPYYFEVEEAHKEIDNFEKMLQEYTDQNVEVFIHLDPCIATSCPVCHKTDCEKRKAPINKALDWNLENMTKNQKHNLPD